MNGQTLEEYIDEIMTLGKFDKLLVEMCHHKIPVTRNYLYDKPSRADEIIRSAARFMKKNPQFKLNSTVIRKDPYLEIVSNKDIGYVSFDHLNRIHFYEKTGDSVIIKPSSLLVRWSDSLDESCFIINSDKSKRLVRTSRKTRKKQNKRGYETLSINSETHAPESRFDGEELSNTAVHLTKKGFLFLAYSNSSKYMHPEYRRELVQEKLMRKSYVKVKN